MPIRPELRPRYPANWSELRARILARSGNRCEQCGKPDRVHVGVIWDGSGHWLDLESNQWKDRFGHSISAREPGTRPRRRLRRTLVVLTIAHHPDPTPENVDESNLHAWCQGCHLRADRPLHTQNARRTRVRRRLDERSRSQPEIPQLSWS